MTLAVPPLGAVQGAPVRLTPRQLRMSWYTMFNQLPLLPERTVDRWLPRLWRDWSPGYDAAEDVALVRAAWPTRAHVAAAVGYYRAIRAPWRCPRRTASWARTLNGIPTVPQLLPARRRRRLHAGGVRRARGHQPAATPRCFELVAGAGHFLQVEKPEVVNELISEFVLSAG